MSETNKFEDAIHELLSGDTKKHALDFAAYLREIGMPPVWGGTWDVNYKDAEGVCHILVNGNAQYPGPWTIWTDSEFYNAPDDFPVNENLKENVWAHIKVCSSCGCGNSPGKRKTILGKEFDNVCHAALEFTDPDTEALDCAKKLMLLRKNAIDKKNAQVEADTP